MKLYELYNNDGRTRKPIVDKDDEPLALECDDNNPPQNGDLIELNSKEYTIQRVWLDGKMVLHLRQAYGVIKC